MGGTSATVTPAVGGALNTVVNDFINTTQPKRLPTVGSLKLQRRMSENAQSALETLLGQMYETSGGANQAVIQQLQAQRRAVQQNYRTNRADAQNLYGVLSQDIERMGEAEQSGYTTSIDESQEQASARQDALVAEQARQQANRQRVAAELGLPVESIQTDYSSDQALNEAMGDVASSATSWENLLSSQQGSAMERTNRLLAGTKNTRNQTLLGMKALLDAQQAQIDAQIAGERSKTPTQKLTPLGRVLSGAMNEQTLKMAQSQFPELFGSEEVTLTGAEQAAQDAMTQLGINAQQYSTLKTSAIQKVQKGNSADLTEQEIIVLQSTGIPQWMLGG
jgi:hypothetical protein